jgi:hypothetical protein
MSRLTPIYECVHWSPHSSKALAMVTNPHHRTLPVELSYQILEEAWHLPLSTTERRDLLVALPLVCTSFRWIASHLFLRDAHVISPSYATHLLSFLQRLDRLQGHSFDGRSSPDAAAGTLRCSCRSITFHIYDPTSSPDILHLHHPQASSNPTIKALDTTLLALSRDTTLAPSLHRIALHYTGWSFTHELGYPRFAHLPQHVRTLELRFATPAGLSRRLRQLYLRCFALPMRGVRSLRIYGTCPEFVADVASACPALESLETDDNDAYELLVLQPSLRPFMSQTVGDRTQVKGPSLAVSHGSKSKNLEWSGNVRAKREMILRKRVWK